MNTFVSGFIVGFVVLAAFEIAAICLIGLIFAPKAAAAQQRRELVEADKRQKEDRHKGCAGILQGFLLAEIRRHPLGKTYCDENVRALDVHCYPVAEGWFVVLSYNHSFKSDQILAITVTDVAGSPCAVIGGENPRQYFDFNELVGDIGDFVAEWNPTAPAGERVP